MPATPLHPGGLSREERIGLAIAIALHVGLVAWLALDRLSKDIQPPPERMTVSFAEAVAPEAVSPQTAAQAAPDLAPTLGEPAPEPLPVVEPMPEPEPAPMPRTVTTPQARPVLPAAKPAVRATAAPRTPQAPASKSAPAKPAAGKPAQPSAKPGASRIGNDFLKGVGGEARGTSQTPPAANVGPQVAASLSQAISRELKPHWSAPQGVEADQLVTVLAFDLNEDGSLAGRPRVVSQAGVTDANRAQQARHAEQAIRAIQLAAPFNLPARYYSVWKRVESFRFDRRLSQ